MPTVVDRDVEAESVDLKNGKYKSRLGLPDLTDINLKLEGDGKSKSIDWGYYEPDERGKSQVGSL